MKYCWEYTDDYLEYRNSLGLDTKNPRWYIKDFSRYLKESYPNETIITEEMACGRNAPAFFVFRYPM